MIRRCLVGLAGFALVACSPFGGGDREKLAVDLAVPYVAQQRDTDCAAAALASLLADAGRPVAIEAIDRAVYTPALRGALLPDMENYLRREGLSPHSGRGDPDLLRQVLGSGRPVVVPLDLGAGPVKKPHYVVVHGYGTKRFLVHAGSRRDVLLSEAELVRRWDRMGRLYLYLEDEP